MDGGRSPTRRRSPASTRASAASSPRPARKSCRHGRRSRATRTRSTPPTRLAQLLAERGVEIVPVPDEEFETMGGNVLALAPRRALVVSGNPETRRRLEGAGVEVMAYEGSELSKGDGGPTCLTCPILRA